MTVKDLMEMIDTYYNTVELRTGNEFYYDIVETINPGVNVEYEGEYADRNVCVIEAPDSYKIVLWLS